MKLKKIYIFTDAPIPVGFAPTNRILSYASGFEKNGVECEIIIFRKTESPNHIKNYKSISRIGKTGYKYLFKTPVKSKSFIKRRLDNTFGLLRLIFESLKLEQKAVIIYYSSYTRYIIVLKLVSFFKKFYLIKEESEHPEVRKKVKYYISWIMFKLIHYRLFDSILLMTNNLMEYFKQEYPSLKRVHIPMTVDIDRFKGRYNRQNYIIFIGSLSNKKDGILYFLEAYAKSNVKNRWKLLVCGFYNSKQERKNFEQKVIELDLEKNIELRYNVNRNEVPKLLMEAKLAVLPRPCSKQAQNGFPTKLGEYLAAATPTLVTSVGEIPNYLKNKVSSYIIPPGDKLSMKERLDFIFNNYDKAIDVGVNGRFVAEKQFNNIIQSKKIIDFIKGEKFLSKV